MDKPWWNDFMYLKQRIDYAEGKSDEQFAKNLDQYSKNLFMEAKIENLFSKVKMWGIVYLLINIIIPIVAAFITRK